MLTIDEIGYLPFGRDQVKLYLQAIAKRYENGSVALTSNLTFGSWKEALTGDRKRHPSHRDQTGSLSTAANFAVPSHNAGFVQAENRRGAQAAPSTRTGLRA